MKIPGTLSGQNDMLNSVMAAREANTGSSYAELAMHGRRTATNMQQTQQGKAAVKEMKIHVEKDEQSIEEETAKTLAKKKELEKTEAQRIAKKQEESSKSSTPSPSAQGDTVEISDAGLEAAQAITVVASPPQVAAPQQPTPSPTPSSAAGAVATTEVPKLEQTI